MNFIFIFFNDALLYKSILLYSLFVIYFFNGLSLELEAYVYNRYLYLSYSRFRRSRDAFFLLRGHRATTLQCEII